MAEVTTIEVTYYTVKAVMEISYRWYVPGSDPWERLTGKRVIPLDGDWENVAFSGNLKNVRMYNSMAEHAMTLKKFRRTKVGSKGEGEFYIDGYLIPQYSTFNWKVMDFSG